MKTITTQNAIKWMLKALDKGIIFGIRGDNFCPSDSFENSNRWDNGIMTNGELSGLSCLKVWNESYINQSLVETKKYGKYTFIIIGETEEGGEDSNEIIIGNHNIYAKIIN